MIETESELKARQEVSISYAQMMDTWAWKDFQKQLEKMRSQTIRDFANVSDEGNVVFRVAGYKGELQCLNKIDHFLRSVTSKA